MQRDGLWTNSVLLEVPEGRNSVAHCACPERSEGVAVGKWTDVDEETPAGVTHGTQQEEIN